MAGFSETERERIESALVEAGREQFARYGPEKTTVSELADAAGISTGSFYTFFDSKARLYLAVLEAEAETIYGDVVANSLAVEDDPEAAVRAFLHEWFDVAQENPLVRNLLEGDYRDTLLEVATPEEYEAAVEQKVSLLAPHIEDWQDAGAVRDGDPGTLALAVESVGFLALHRAEYDSPEEYERVRDALIELVAAGLTVTDD